MLSVDWFAQMLRRWLQPADREQQFLESASDHADLERRMRVLERARGGPIFVTFNH